MPSRPLRDPVRSVNAEILSHLEMVSNTIYPLPGGSARRGDSSPDPRLPHLKEAVGEEVMFYEHVATIRDWNTNTFFVAFRQTMDALLAEQKDPNRYPEWLMKDPVKKTELKVYIYQATQHPRKVAVMRSHEDWLTHIADPGLFDTLAFFLLKNNVINQDMYGKM